MTLEPLPREVEVFFNHLKKAAQLASVAAVTAASEATFAEAHSFSGCIDVDLHEEISASELD